MARFPFAHSHGRSAELLLEQCLTQLGQLPSSASLGFMFATDALAPALATMVAALKQRTGVPHWIGSVGVGVSATAQEYYDEPALALMLVDLPPDSFRIVPAQHHNLEPYLATIAPWLARDQFHFGMLHADPSNQGASALIDELAARVPGAFLVGGLSSLQGQPAQVADTLSSGGVSGVLFDSQVAVVTSHTQGCTPLGPSHVITACERNILIELDQRPALEVFREDIGEVLARDLNQVSGYIFAGFPVTGSDTGDYVVRNLLGIDRERQLLALGEYLTPGRTLMFCRRDGNSAREDLERMLVDLGRRMGRSPKGAVYYSCLGRGRHQFGANAAELRMIAAALGDLPLVGFFANGEIFHNRLYAYTGVLTIFC